MTRAFIEGIRIGFWRSALAALVLLLGGCLITVNYGAGGRVSSDVENECFFNCIYNVGPGESLERTLTALPDPGWEFVRWIDSLGEGFSVCAQPVLPVCSLSVEDLPEVLDPFELVLQPVFTPNDGYHLTWAGYSNPEQMTGVFRQRSAARWEEEFQDGQVFSYVLAFRTLTTVGLSDAQRKFVYVIDLGAGIITLSQDGGDPEGVAGIVAATSVTSGWSVNAIAFGNEAGQLQGRYLQVDELTWHKFNRKSATPRAMFDEVERGDSMLLLRNQATGAELEFDLAAGRIYRPDDPERTLAFIHSRLQTPTGWRTAYAEYADMETGKVLGYFEQISTTGWEQRDAATDRLLASYGELNRDATVINLLDPQTGQRIRINVEERVILLAPAGSGLLLPRWDIDELR